MGRREGGRVWSPGWVGGREERYRNLGWVEGGRKGIGVWGG